MDLSEALTFTPTSVIQSSSSPISRNRSGLVHICSTPDSSAIFHYSPQSQRLSYYNHAVTNDPQSNNDIDIAIASIQIQNVIHISCSYDGRMVLAFVGNGSIICLDVTSSSLSIRWHKDDMHSHTGPYGAGIDTDIDIADRTANCHLGPIHSVQWIPKAGKYTCLYVDAVQGCYLLQCNARDDDGDRVMAQSLSDLIDEAPSKILVATWEPRYARRIAVGCADGSIGFMTLLMSDDNDGDDDGDGEGSFSWNVTQQNFIVPELVEEEEQEEVRWSVTHLDWFHEWYLAVGFCRVFPDDAGGEYPSDGNDNDDGDDDAMDDAQHEANLCIYCEPNLAWMELGDVVAFFGVPKYGRHVFYTQFVWCGEDPVDRDSSFGILLVGCNVTGEIGVVDLDRCDHTMWELCDLQEGNALTAPITDDDEFSVPTGLAVAVNGRNRKIDVLLSATDGSLSVYELDHATNDIYGNFTGKVQPWRIQEDAVQSVHVGVRLGRKSASEEQEPPQLVGESNVESVPTPEAEEEDKEEAKVDEPAPTEVEEETERNPFQAPATASSFGSVAHTGFTFGSGTSAPLFGSGTKPSFGFGFTAPSTPAPATDAKPPTPEDASAAAAARGPFGAPPSAPVFGSTATLGTSSTAAPFGSPSAPVFGSTTLLGSSATTTTAAAAAATTSFGSKTTSTSTPTVFGSTTGSATSPAPAPASAFGSSAFGLSNTSVGAFSLASTTSSAPAPTLTDTEKKAPVFGSGSAAPVFGSSDSGGGGTNTGFGFGSLASASSTGGSSSMGGFGALAANTQGMTGFGFGSGSGSGSGSTPSPHKSPFGAFDKQTPQKGGIDPSMVKPLFGQTRKPEPTLVDSDDSEEEEEEEKEIERDVVQVEVPVTASPQTSNTSQQVDVTPDTAEAKRAAEAFDNVDTDQAGQLPTAMLENLLDEIGEGFHGDELDKQLLLLDPTSSGFITRSAFVEWYGKLGEDSDGDDSLDTDEREEREEEKAKAQDAFDNIATSGIVQKDDFGKLMEAMGTVYCEEAHRRTLKKISDDDGNISKEAFVGWYIEWMYNDDDDESHYSGEEEDGGDGADDRSSSVPVSEGWGNIFASKKEMWKCEACMVMNEMNVSKCVACETVRPGHEENADKEDGGKGMSAAGVSSSGGFTFSASGASSTGGGGFTFSATGAPSGAPSTGPGTTGSSGGFTFGAAPSTSGAGGPSVGGFSFGAPTSSTTIPASSPSIGFSVKAPPAPTESVREGGFSFRATSTSKSEKPEIKASTKVSAPIFPPLSTKAPTPFGGAAKPVSKPSTSSASAFPPMSTKAPTPFGGAAKPVSKPSTSSASAFPPMSTKAPTPFGGAPKPSSKQISSDPKGSQNYIAASEYEAQFWILLRDILVSLDKVNYDAKSLTNDVSSTGCERNAKIEVESIVQSVQLLMSTVNLIKDEAKNGTQSSIALLSRKDDLVRQIEESTKGLGVYLNKDDLAGDTHPISQPLDNESEKSKRQLVTKALSSQRSVARLQEQVVLLSGLSRTPSMARSTTLFSRVPRRRQKKELGLTGTKLVFQSLKSGFERTTKLDNATKRLHQEVESCLKQNGVDSSIESFQTLSTSRSNRHKKRIEALPFSSQSSFASSSKAKCDIPNISTVNALRTLKLSHYVTTKQFQRLDLNFGFDGFGESNIDSQSWRSKTSSQMMDNSKSFNTSIAAHLPRSISHRNSERSLSMDKSRVGWEVTDTQLVESTLLNLPSSIKQIDSNKAANQALAPFGVTPDLMLSVKKIKERGATKSKSSSGSNLQKTTAPISSGFPPLSSKAPKPFGSSGESKAEDKPKSSVAFPPMSKLAPKPFTSSTKSESTLTTTAQATAKSSTTASKSGNTAASPPLPTKAPTPFGGSGSCKDTSKKDSSSGLFGGSKPVNSITSNTTKDKADFNSVGQSKATKKVDPKSTSSELFSGMMGMSNALDEPAKNSPVASTNVPQPGGTSNIDYKSVLTQFYTNHNASKVGEVAKTLQKYRGHEKELFAKLAKKYNVQNPLEQTSTPSTFGASPASSPLPSGTFGTPLAAPTASPFVATNLSTSTTKSPFGSAPTSASTPFGGSTSSSGPFSGTTPTLGFGQTTTSPFGQQSKSIATTPFGQAPTPAATPFGQSPTPAAPGVSPFGGGTSAASSAAKTFGGKTAREILTAFYQQRNPSKLSEIDKLLAKYAGKEESLLRNLAKKYNLDPSYFGLSAASQVPATPGFGSASALGQPAQFGQASSMRGSGGFGSFAAAPSTGFGSFAQSAQASSSTGFGAATTPSPGGFGSMGGAAGFGGSSSTPFGSARR